MTGYFYALTLDARQHRVGINGVCSYYLGRHCPAVEIVRAYLNHGEQRAANSLSMEHRPQAERVGRWRENEIMLHLNTLPRALVQVIEEMLIFVDESPIE